MCACCVFQTKTGGGIRLIGIFHPVPKIVQCKKLTLNGNLDTPLHVPLNPDPN